MKKVLLLTLLCLIQSLSFGQTYGVVFEDDFNSEINANLLVPITSPIIIEDPSTISLERYWDPITFKDSQEKWYAYFKRDHCVTHALGYEHQVYRPSQCVFDFVNGQIRLKSSYEENGISNYWCPYHNDENAPSSSQLYFYSGALEAVNRYNYGYYEIRCKLPNHKGAFPAFWLYGPNDVYQEIDIFEYSQIDYEGSQSYSFGKYCPTPDEDGHYESTYNTKSQLSDWNVFACEWQRDRIRWYFNNIMVGERIDDCIPTGSLALRVNYAINNYVCTDNSCQELDWTTGDEMDVDYVRVHQYSSLPYQCTDIEIHSSSDFDDDTKYCYTHNSIMISTNNPDDIITFPSGKSAILSVSSLITIDGSFEVPLGSQLSFHFNNCSD